MGFVTYATKTIEGISGKVEVITGYAGGIGQTLDLSQERGKYIDSEAFYMKDMRKVIFPKNLISIGSSAFADCDELSEVVFPDGLCDIGAESFSGCSNIKKIVLPKQVKSIGYAAFNGCGHLLEVSLPDGLKTIDAWAFAKCESLEGNLYIPKDVTSIGECAFSDTYIEKAFLPDTLLDIGEDAFPSDCELIQIPYDKYDDEIKQYKAEEDKEKAAQIKRWEEAAKKLAEEEERKAAKEKERKAAETAKKNAERIAKAEAKAVMEELKKDKDAEELIIPKCIKVIEENSFYGWKSLKKIVFAEGSELEKIERGAFECCESLQEIILPVTIQRIEDNAFRWCRKLKTVIVPKGSKLKWIGSSAFYGCSELSTVVLYGEDIVLSRWAFQYCHKIRKINLKYVKCAREAFWECSHLKEAIVRTEGTDKISDVPVAIIRKDFSEIPDPEISNDLGWEEGVGVDAVVKNVIDKVKKLFDLFK